MQLGGHHVQPRDFYFRVNWECLVKQEIFSKQSDLGEGYLDTLFNPETLTQFLGKAKVQLGSTTSNFWTDLLAALAREGHYSTPQTVSQPLQIPTALPLWQNCPKLDTWSDNTEKSFTEFLNKIVLGIEEVTHFPAIRSWTAKYSTSCVFGHNACHKPDLVLLDGWPTMKDTSSSANWRVARAVAELKSSSKTTAWKEIGEQLAGESQSLS